MSHPAQAKEIFLAAVEIGSGEPRIAFLDEACSGDAELRRRVEALIDAHERPERLLDQAAVAIRPRAADLAQADAMPSIDGSPGTLVGPYRLLKQIGEGGMGMVYAAEQDHPVRRKVALKLVKPGMDTRQVVARFEVERQALAVLDHPHIARVIDGGATPSGRPYFVMELVDGVPITEYCDREHFTIPQRLELLILVCRGVQHAHQRGIIHRDLKPSNILVTLQDGVPVPKVIDFGIAKAIGQSLTGETLHTNCAQLIGTPRHMSPEQAELGGMDIDTRSDVYSLGVLLYELLTGSTPFDEQALHEATFDEIRRIIREQEPPRPSTRLGGLGADLATVSSQRGSHPRKLVQSVRGELDWIVMRCLEKDRARRYETPNALAADLIRYLSDRPVEACAPSLRYRFAKCVRRNCAMLATASVVSLAMIAVTTISIWQAIRATVAEKRMAAALSEAKQQRRLAERHLHAALLRQARQAIDLGQIERAQEILEEIGAGPDDHDSRDFARRYLGRRARREIIPLRADDRRLVNFALSPDGRTIAVSDSEFRIRLWDLETRRWRADLTGTNTHAFEPVFSPDGRRLVAVESDGTTIELEHRRGAIVWDTATGWLLTRIPTRRDGVTLYGAAFLDDHTVVLAQSDPRADQVVTLWRLEPDRGRPARFTLYPERDVANWPPGQHLIVRKRDRLRLVDPGSGAARVELAGAYGSDVGPWSRSEDGRVVVAGVADCRVVLWDAATGRELDRYSADSGPYRQILFSPDGNRVAARDDTNGRIHLWDRSSRRPNTLQVDEPGRSREVSMAFSRDGRRLAVSSWGTPGGALPVALWDVATGRRVRKCPASPPAGGAGRLAFTPDGRFLVLAGSRGINLWRLAPDPPIEPAGHADEVWTVAFSPDGRMLASGSDDTENDDTIKLWDPGTGRLLKGWRTGEGTISALAFSPDGQTLASAALCPSRNLRLWDITTGRLCATLEGHTDRVRSVAFSPDGRTLASAGSDRTIHLWDARTGRARATLSGHSDTIRKVVFSPDGLTLASASNDRSVRLWDVNTGKMIRELRTLQIVSAVSFAPDGSLLASADEGGDITFWNPETGDRQSAIHSDHNQLLTLAFSPDGRALAAAGWSRVVRIWDVLTGQELLTLSGHAAQINAVAFSPDGRTLASCGHDGAVKLWRSDEQR